MSRLLALISLGIGWTLVGPQVFAADQATQPIVVCAVPNSLPRMGKAEDGTPQGLDVAVMQLVAKELGRTLEFHWCANAGCSWNCVRQKKCDVVIGQPHGSGPGREIAWTQPYSGSRFGLVMRKDVERLADPADLSGKRVGKVAGSAGFAIPNQTVVEFKTREELLVAVSNRKIDAAFVDDDFAAWHLHRHPELSLRRVAEYVPRERWNFGFAVRAADQALLKELNRALSKLEANGQISKAFAEQGVPFRAPFSAEEKKPVVAETWKTIREKGELRISMDPANLPYSSADDDRPGFDVELARELAAIWNVKLKLEWMDIHRETAIGELLDGDCDLAFGAAIDPRAMEDEEPLDGKVIYSVPYYGTGYFLVMRDDGEAVKSLTELAGEKSRRIGAETGSIADYRLRQRGYLRRLFRSQLAALKSLHDGGIDYAYLWANVGWTLHTSPELKSRLVENYVPEDHWNIAVALRRGDVELKQQVDAALKKLIADGKVARALEKYHVPYLPPFAEPERVAPGEVKSSAVESKASADSDSVVIRHLPTDRGIEPKMSVRQKSKQGYTDLERIRSAGLLVVGLDHNSLPFSSAHPEPGGLDYEVAELLAEQLGVKLQPYWGYSSHDSYPSKLATKKLCDVMLGVTPDDRFGRRVIYSEPYYFAEYQRVFSAESETPPVETPLALERGLALREIGDRPIHEYRDLEGILLAVADGKERAGYVLSSKSRWLAQKLCPGRLQWERNSAENGHRFPVCVAMRKGETDLAAAINGALDELSRSGELAAVFDRWHMSDLIPSAKETARDAGSSSEISDSP